MRQQKGAKIPFYMWAKGAKGVGFSHFEQMGLDPFLLQKWE